MTENITRSVDAGAFAVPQRKDVVASPFATQVSLLRSPNRGGGQIFLKAFLKNNARRFQKFGSAGELLIYGT
jgi:hypothetical protein|tara:strand:+ start:6845 stop:7060 length:216 start_codon:yes stop_codon:yes gene_type:complete